MGTPRTATDHRSRPPVADTQRPADAIQRALELGARACVAQGWHAPEPEALHSAAAREVYRIVFEAIASDAGHDPAVAASLLEQSSATELIAVDKASRTEILLLLEDITIEAAADRCRNAANVLGDLHQVALGFAVEHDGCRIRVAATEASRRRARGAFYTPPELVEHLLDSAMDPCVADLLDPAHQPTSDHRSSALSALLSIRLCDPTCGSGNFLVAAARRLGVTLAQRRGSVGDEDVEQATADVIARCIFGVDIDSLAIACCRLSLWLASGGRVGAEHLATRIRVGDALLDASLDSATDDDASDRFSWRSSFPNVLGPGAPGGVSGFDVVVGNPPFLNQLSHATSLTRRDAARLRSHTEGAVAGYADTASACLLRSTELCRPGGRVAMLQPLSFLASKHTAPVRRKLLERSSLVALWHSDRTRFGAAAVATCAPTLLVGQHKPQAVACTRGLSQPITRVLPPEDLLKRGTWAHLTTAADAVPNISLTPRATIASLATATADFRDQYYGLAGFLIEDDDIASDSRNADGAYAPVVTSGLIDLAVCRWGTSPARLLKHTWRAPRVDRQRMARDGKLSPWIDRRLVPKIIVATQTRAIEAYVDHAGELLPSTPLITVIPRPPEDIWSVAAAIASPVSTACAVERYAGTALSPGAIKLGASQVLELPAPDHSEASAVAAEMFKRAQDAGDRDPTDDDAREAALRDFGRASIEAFGLPIALRDPLFQWWADRLTKKRRS